MKKLITLTTIVVSLLVTSANGSPNPRRPNFSLDKNQIVIRVAQGDWGDADVKDIQVVLQSAADELLRYFPRRNLNPIMVEHGESPKTLYRRGPNGEYIVRLAVKGTYWSQFVYQFAHELTHVLAKYENIKVDQNPNQWFEESICVTGSLFVLRRMAVTWRTSPPHSNWKSYAPSLRRYADDRLSESGRQLPSDMTLARWYKKNKANLRTSDVDSTDARNKQYVVANELLPIFEESPDLWESIGYLNERETDNSYFENYLNNWYTNSPEKYKRSIREIIYMFSE